MLSCRYTRSRMTLYINGELPPHVRRRITQHLDTCATCSARYVRERELTQQLKSRLVYVGQPGAPQLRRLWSKIQADMYGGSMPRPAYRRIYSARYGLVALGFVLVLLVPLTLGNRNVPYNVPLPPAPELSAAATETPYGTRSVATVALNLTGAGKRTPNVDVWNTPAPARQ